MWLIPGKTKVKMEIFKGVSLADVVIGVITFALLVCLFISNFGTTTKIVLLVVVLFIAALLLVRIDDEPNYMMFKRIIHYFAFPRYYIKDQNDKFFIKKKKDGEFAAALDAFYGSEDDEELEELTRDEDSIKARRKAEKEEYKLDSKRLKSKELTKEEEDAIWLKRAEQSARRKKERREARENNKNYASMQDISAFTDIADDFIVYGNQYYGAAIEIKPVEFRFFSEHRRNNTIVNGIGRVLRNLGIEYSANIVKIERPIKYDVYWQREHDKVDELRAAYEAAVISEEEFKARVEVVFDRIHEIEGYMERSKVVVPHYYLVLFDSDKGQLKNNITSALSDLENAELIVNRLDSKELALFLKYSNCLDFDENEIEDVLPEDYAAWAMPNELSFQVRTAVVNNILTHNMRVTQFPSLAQDSWLATQMSIPSTKVVVKCQPMDRQKAIRNIDRSLNELRVQYNNTNTESKLLEIQEHIESLSALLVTLQNDSESLLEVNIYVTAYDLVASENKMLEPPSNSSLVRITNMKRTVRRYYSEARLKLNSMDFEQVKTYIGSQVSAYDPFGKDGRGIPSNTVSASYPWIFAHVSDVGGIKLGESDGVPVFIDFFRRDSERVNSNMVIIGKSGSGKSFATKSLLTNLAADDAKIFILDPENEYTELAKNLHGKFINVGNAQYGRLNPFHIMTALEDDEADSSTVSGSYATHLQFLEEFFRQIIPDADKDAMEYLNSIIDRMYTDKGITPETDLSKLKPTDYPIFDDLYDAILQEFQKTENEYIRTMLRNLMNYISKFSTGGRNANIWNGESTVTTDENFSVFNFQNLLANRNGSIANAQMLLVLKYIDNEIIKNRDYNIKNHTNRKIVVVIDEAHVFIDEKYPIALDFMFQLAKRIRKYNGMQIVITQNIKDFVGSEELARKSTAIINACQYSFIFALAPNDMDDLCKLYEKAGGINEMEQEQIVNAPRGQAFVVMGPQSRTSFQIEVPENVVRMFSNGEFESRYFAGEEGEEVWEEFLDDSRELYEQSFDEKLASRFAGMDEEEETGKSYVHFEEVNLEDVGLKEEESNVNFNIEDYEDDFSRMIRGFDDEDEDEDEFFSRSADLAPSNTSSKDAGAADSSITQFMERFSYDAMTAELRNMLASELSRSKEESRMLIEEARKEADEIRSRAFAEIEALKGLVASGATVVNSNTTNANTGAAVTPAQPADNSADDEDDDFFSFFRFNGDDTDSSGETESSDNTDEDDSTSAKNVEIETPEKEELDMDSFFTFDTGDSEEGTSDNTSLFGDDDTEEPGFDIMSKLLSEAKDLGDISVIERMEVDDANVIDITVEDLTQYIINLSRRGLDNGASAW